MQREGSRLIQKEVTQVLHLLRRVSLCWAQQMRQWGTQELMSLVLTTSLHSISESKVVLIRLLESRLILTPV